MYQNTLPGHPPFCFTPPCSLSDPMAVLYEQIPGTSAWRERGRTELLLNNEGKTLQPQSVPRPSRTLCSWKTMVAGSDLWTFTLLSPCLTPLDQIPPSSSASAYCCGVTSPSV